MWQAGLLHGMKYETGRGHRWQPCHKASVRMTGPKTPVCYADISAANRKVQALTAAGPRDGERVNNLADAICWGWSNVKVSFHPSLHFLSFWLYRFTHFCEQRLIKCIVIWIKHYFRGMQILIYIKLWGEWWCMIKPICTGASGINPTVWLTL